MGLITIKAVDMKAALIAKGSGFLITMDAEGDNTLTSIVRCKELYHKDKIIVVSQPYHVKRAVYTASKKGIDAMGFFYGDVGRSTPPREYISRLKAVFFQ